MNSLQASIACGLVYVLKEFMNLERPAHRTSCVSGLFLTQLAILVTQSDAAILLLVRL